MIHPFLSRTQFGNPVDLYEAYKRIQKYKEALSTLLKVDLLLYPTHRTQISNEIDRLAKWLSEQDKIIKIEFVVEG